jgi:hypothetical protein
MAARKKGAILAILLLFSKYTPAHVTVLILMLLHQWLGEIARKPETLDVLPISQPWRDGDVLGGSDQLLRTT